MENKLTMKFLSISENEHFVRGAISSFVLPLNPSVDELNDIKIAISEAVTNVIVHGYPDSVGEITINTYYDDNDLYIEIIDNGIGIENLEQALMPSYTTKEDKERAGMGFTLMKTLMDDFQIESIPNKGTKVILKKTILSNL